MTSVRKQTKIAVLTVNMITVLIVNLNNNLIHFVICHTFVIPGNRPHPASRTPPFADTDKRRQYCVQNFNPKVHFALVCGAKVRSYIL